jgi:hypothetical protein
MSLRNVVYVTLITCPPLVYNNREASHDLPLVLKVGKSAGSLVRRSMGAIHIVTLCVMRAPPEGVHNCELELKKCLQTSCSLRVGRYVRGRFVKFVECFVPDLKTMLKVQSFMVKGKYDVLDCCNWRQEDPLDVMIAHVEKLHERAPMVAALEDGDGLTAEEVRTLLAYDVTLPIGSEEARLVLNKFAWARGR